MLRTLIAGLVAASILTCASVPASAGDPVPFSARAGLDVAQDAARSWASDARLVYLENDEIVGSTGEAARWGYLFYSARRGTTRGYSVRDGKILEAADLGFDFEAPPLAGEWIDSHAALVAAEKEAGQVYRTEHAGQLASMLLIRGAFDGEKPDATTWAMVYTSQTAPTLFVVVDASNGKVTRTWRG